MTLVAIVFSAFACLEPMLIRAVEDADSVVVNQGVTAGITISSPTDITMTMLSLVQDSAVGDATWNVITNNQAGYSLVVNTSASPALVDSGTSEAFSDYSSVSKETWLVSDAYEFGWSAYGNDVTGHGTDTDCINTADVPSSTLLWEGFNGVTPIQMASSTSETNMAGTTSTICIATEQDTVFAPSGSYSATITATAITQ